MQKGMSKFYKMPVYYISQTISKTEKSWNEVELQTHKGQWTAKEVAAEILLDVKGLPDRYFLMFKSRLQEYSQKAGLPLPVYETANEGTPHDPRFRTSVTVKGIKYESPLGFRSLKQAQHAAAKVALDSLTKVASGQTTLYSLGESGLCKNLLQEYAQKSGMQIPIYTTESIGKAYISTVQVGDKAYRGPVESVRKKAEIKAANFALVSIHAEQQGGMQGYTDESYGSLVSNNKKRKSADRSVSPEPVAKVINANKMPISTTQQ